MSGWGLPPVIDWGQILYSAIRPEMFPGCDPTGQSDSTSAVVAARAAALSAGAVCWLEGIYQVTATQTLQGSEWLHFPQRSSRMIANFTGGAMFFSQGFGTATKANDIRLTGPGKIGRNNTAQTGDILHLYGDRLHVQDLVIDTWGGGRAFYGGGDHHFAWNVTAQNNDGQIGTGGWRFAVGSYGRFHGLDIDSGDDALQFVPEGLNTASLFNAGDIAHCWYENCVGRSRSARVMAVALVGSGGGLGQMSTNIMHSGFRDCHGQGNQRGIFVSNRDSYGGIFNMLFAGCSVDQAGGTAFNEDVFVNEDPSSSGSFTGHVLGPLRGVTFEDLSILNSVATGSPLRVLGATENTTIQRPFLYLPASAANAIIELTGGTGFRVRDGYLDGQSQAHPLILIGGGGTLTTDVHVDGTRLVGIGSSQFAVNANAAAGFWMGNTRCEPGAAQTLTKGWRTGATTTNARIRDNDFGQLGATPFLDTGTGTQHSGNVGMGD